MARKGVNFINKQTKIREFYPVEKIHGLTFEDIAHELYEKLLLEGKSIQGLMSERDNLINTEERAGLIKFFYIEDGIEVPITKAELVIEVYFETGKNEFLFFVDVIGGRSQGGDSPLVIEETSHMVFVAHARELVKNPRLHGSWRLIEYEVNKFRLMKIVRDKHRRKITMIIQPNAGYPGRPPLVTTIPPHRDPCFSSEGELNWTVVRADGRYTWEMYAGHSNPLTYLFGELKTKYKLVF
ncbi:MAG: hypothetical protein GY847_30795 [Proteobacteria bacterium]|nr:hypothetical protein [Pseudomonadota bacterium]